MLDGTDSLSTLISETLCNAFHRNNADADRFDGNISETAFSHRVVSSSGSPYLQTNTWSYAYDGLKRLTDADHYPGAALTPSLTDTERDIAYDRNGNITALKRYGASGLENDLSFTHTGNRMTALSDASATGTEAGTKSLTYDANGNMTSDGRKGLELRWNVLYCSTVLILLIHTSRPLWLGIVFSVLFLLSLVGLGFLLLERNAFKQNEKERVVSGILQSVVLVSAVLYCCIKIT